VNDPLLIFPIILLFGLAAIFISVSKAPKSSGTLIKLPRCPLHKWIPHDAKGPIPPEEPERIRGSYLLCLYCGRRPGSVETEHGNY
jgi:hypothetical protein